MTDKLAPISPARAGDPIAHTGNEEIELRRFGDALRRNRWVVLGTTAVMVGAAALFAALQRPVYESEATILIAEERPGLDILRGMLPAGLGAMAGLSGRSDLQTDVLVLRSRQVAEGVVDSLGMRVVLRERGKLRDEFLQVLESGRGAGQGVYRLQRSSDGAYTLHFEEGKRPAQLPSRVEIAERFRLDDLTLRLNPALRADPPERLRFEILPFRTAVGDVQKKLRVASSAPGAQIVKVHFRNSDPVLAAAVPNVVAESFLRYKSRVGRAEAHSTIEFLEQQSATYEAELRAAEARLQGFREQAQIVEPKTQATEQVRRLAELQANRDALQMERESLRRLLGRIESQPAARPSERSPYRELAAFPAFITNATVQNILESLIQQENERARLLVQRTPQSIDVQGIDQRIGELELQLYQLARNYLDGLDNRIVSLDGQLARFAGQIEQVPAREVEFFRLGREQKLLEEVYTLIQTKLKEAQIQEASEPGNVRLVDSALVPEKPVSPRPLLYMLLATVVGLMLGAGGVVVREVLDTRVRTREDVAAAGLPLFGVIPRFRLPARVNGNGAAKRSLLHPESRKLLARPLVAREDPGSPASEAFRSLRTSLLLSAAEGLPQVLVVTSATADDGKSTTAANLAITLAQQGTRTVLVDADLRRGTLHQIFGLERMPGLAELLEGEADLEDTLRQVSAGPAGTPLDVVLAGQAPTSPAEVLGSEAMRALLDHLRGRYGAIILDAPPLNPVTDTALLALAADGVLLVARSGATDREALQEAADQVRRLRVPLSGVVLNDVEPVASPYYSGQSA
ncbi:MAG: polysaccharide biosynthesis tyrosine autokinase [Gemmatimonadetes bacterium]|nr:polysaccharide biosynthesis tyrosine autokinase [Gemmatimonadota bacterium]MBA4159399.1 polysaccharide biosynthesis tyrosine autokinase [Gemmatimonadota bacterium]